MVISVFPDYGQAIDRYRSTRSERLERQAQDAQQAAYNRMLAGVPEDQRPMYEVLGPEQGVAMMLQNQQGQSERMAEAREAQLSFLQEEGQRFAEARAAQGDTFDEGGFLRGSVIRASDAGIPLRDPQSLQERVRTWGQGYTVDSGGGGGGTEFERILQGLRPEEQQRLTRARAEYLAGLTRRPGGSSPYGGLSDLLTASQTGSLIQGQVEGANSAISANREVLGLLDDFEYQTELTGEGFGGLLAYLRESGQGVLSQIDQLAQFGAAGQRLSNIAAEAQNSANWEDGSNPSEFFNAELAGLSFLKNTLAYAVAKANDPGGRLSDADVRQSRASLGFGPTSSDEQIMSVFRTIRRRSERSLNNALEDRQSLLNTGSRVDRPMPGQSRPSYIPENVWEDLSTEERRDPLILESARELYGEQ